MDSLPARDGPAAQLARLMNERGLPATMRPLDNLTILTVTNPAVPNGQLSVQVALVPAKRDGGRFVWLFEGTHPGSYVTPTIARAPQVEAVADRIAHVLSLGGQPDAC